MRERPAIAFISPLSTWFEGDAALETFRRRRLRRGPTILTPRDDAWRSVAPSFQEALELAASGMPFQVVADGRYDRSADRRRLRRAVADGKTIFLPQVHQVLPRLMRLMVALRVALLGPCREECSFLFAVQGRGRRGMGLHHDGDVNAVWLQLEGRRTVTVGPALPPGTPEDLDDLRAPSGEAGWWTRDLEPGTLFYLPPRTPHRVVCQGRSLALSMTWGMPVRRTVTKTFVRRLTAWDVVGGQVAAMPPVSRDWLWTQVPAVALPIDRARAGFALSLPDADSVWLPADTYQLAIQLATMPSFRWAPARRFGQGLSLLLAHGIVAPEDLPLRIVPEDITALDGWQFG
jgi:hypothetical protein